MLSLIEGGLAVEFREILNSAKDKTPLSNISKAAILRFLKLQFLRSDWMRDKIPNEFIQENFKPEYIDDADKLIHAYVLSEEIFTEILDYISNYEMKIYTCHPNIEVFTSSFPLFFNHVGSITELIQKLVDLKVSTTPSLETNLFFPISSSHVVYIYDPKKPLGLEEDDWVTTFITSGISWSKRRIYFKSQTANLMMYPLLKTLLKP